MDHRCVDAREGKRELRRRAMLAAAQDLFLEKGYEATTLGDVVGRSGGSFATLYELFQSKLGLLQALVGESCATVGAAVEPAICSEQPVEEALRELAENLFRSLLDPRIVALFRVVVAQSVTRPELGLLFYEAGPVAGQLRIAEYLRRQAEAGRLQIEDPNAASHLFFHMMLGHFHQRLLFGTDAPTPQCQAKHLDFALAAFLRAFRPASS